MTNAKTNEREGTKARARYMRGSASKVRRVLDLIRNESVEDARSILKFSDVGAAEDVSSVLESAVANAAHNDDLDSDELYVSACYADEGATIKRFKPRARGRASRINKRTCHITVIVSRYDDEVLEARNERLQTRAGSAASASEARRRRVQKSQEQAAATAAAAKASDVEGDDSLSTEEEE